MLDYRVQRVDLEIELGRFAEAERHADALERSYRARPDRARDLVRLDGTERAELPGAPRAGKVADAVAIARRAREVLERFPGDLRARAVAAAILAAHDRSAGRRPGYSSRAKNAAVAR